MYVKASNYKKLGVMDMFRAAAGGGTVHTPGSAPAPAPIESNAPAPAATPAPAPSSPLDPFAKMWDTPLDAKGNPVVPSTDPLTTPVFTLDAGKIRESAKNLNFTDGIAPELVTKALSGDIASFMEAINLAGQNAFVAHTLNTGNMINSGVVKNNAGVRASIPGAIRDTQLSQIPVDNPVLEHPAIQPLVQTLRQVQAAKNPNLSPAEIAKQVSDLLTGLSTAMRDNSPEAVAAAKKKTADVTDFDQYLGL